ncbi:hypothetical protein [Pseudoalteromonas rubra]|uniref:hypothetical protein n=1 Tax=Pseudoalteromonas rubra TaxID=43658 RepID=UPI0013EE8D24|nr:hypothetical protein [Pseudoalteromonas rubra]
MMASASTLRIEPVKKLSMRAVKIALNNGNAHPWWTSREFSKNDVVTMWTLSIRHKKAS